jgi:hypothetical protein
MNKTEKHKQFLTLLLTLLTGFAGAAGYCIISCDTEIDFKINWNMFDSVLIIPLLVIGFILGLGIKYQERIPILKKTDRFGDVTYEKNDDLIDNMETSCLMPLLMYFFGYPLMFAAMIYYSIMGIIYLFGAIFPWLIAVYLIISLVFFYKCEKWLLASRASMLKMSLVMWIFTFAVWLMYILWVPSGDKSLLPMNLVALGIALVAAAFCIADAVRQREAVSSGNADTPPKDAVKPPVISIRFIVFYAIAFIFIFGIYCFKSSNVSYVSYITETSSVATDNISKDVSNNNNLIPAPSVKVPENASQPVQKLEQLREKLIRYVEQGKTFSDKVIQFSDAGDSEFGEFRGIVPLSGDRHLGWYSGKNYNLVIILKYTDESHIKIVDFLIDEKGKLYKSTDSYIGCSVFRNGRKTNGGYAGDAVCNEIAVVKLKTASPNCMNAVPIVKAWKVDAEGKFVEVSATGLTWYDECP